MQLEPWHWFVFGIVLIIAEMFAPSFFLLWFGTAGVVVSLVTWLMPIGFLPSVIVWLVLSVLFCALWFKFVQPLIKDRTKAGLGASTIIGDTGMIITAQTGEHTGLVRFATPKAGASEWACRSTDGQVIAVGERVVIVDIVGNELLVARV